MYCAGQSQSVSVRHMKIRNDKIESSTKSFHNFQSLVSAVGLQCRKVFSLKDRPNERSDVGIIINNKREHEFPLRSCFKLEDGRENWVCYGSTPKSHAA